ncbi:MAG: phage tail fiber protein [Gemmatimonadetes bacterium]|nr:phage tail fiber protein [Gemmatimonadota bacterium]
MTVSSITNRINYTGSGIVGPYSYPFRVHNATDIEVTRTTTAGLATTLVYPQDYSVTGVGVRNGGSITLTSALPTGYTLTIRRVVPLTQLTNIRNQGAYLPEVIEDGLDRATMAAQQLAEENARAMTMAVAVDPSTFSAQLPPPVANKVLIYNTSGTALTTATLDTSAIGVPGEGRTTLGATAYLQNNAKYVINDYSAAADNTTNNLAFIQNALNAAGATRGTVLVKYAANFYKVLGTLTIPAHTAIVFERGARLNVISTDQALYAVGQSGIVIEGADISGVFSAGVHADTCDKLEVVNGTFSGATIPGTLGGAAGVFLRDCTNSTIDRNTFSGNGDGVTETMRDIMIAGGASFGNRDNQVTFNKALSTTVDVNIAIFNQGRAVVTGNTASGAISIPASGFIRGGIGILLYNGTTVPPYDVAFDCTVGHNVVHDVDGIGIYLQRYRNTVVSANVVHDTGAVTLDSSLGVAGIVDDGGTGNVITTNSVYNCHKDGITIIGGGGPQSINTSSVVSANQIDNVLNSAFRAISIRGVPSDGLISGNNITRCVGVGIGEWSDGGSIRMSVLGNIMNIMSTYGVWARASSVDWTIGGNIFSGMVDPANAVVNQGANNLVWGSRVNGSRVFPVDTLQQRIALTGPANQGVQLQLGTNGAISALGSRYSGGECVGTTNAVQTTLNVDSWTQSDAAAESSTWFAALNGDFEFYVAPAGRAPGNFATFWGATPKVSLMRTGGIKVNGVAVLGPRVTGWTPQTAAPSRADLGAAPTTAQIASWIAALQNDLTAAHHLLGP